MSDRFERAGQHWITHNEGHVLLDGEGRKVSSSTADKVPEAPSWFRAGKKPDVAPPGKFPQGNVNKNTEKPPETGISVNQKADSVNKPAAPVSQHDELKRQFRKALGMDEPAPPVVDPINHAGAVHIAQDAHKMGTPLSEAEWANLKKRFSQLAQDAGYPIRDLHEQAPTGTAKALRSFAEGQGKTLATYQRELEVELYRRLKELPGQQSLFGDFGDDDEPDGRWITLHGGGEEHGGTHVFINEKGKILKGPDAIQGLNVDELPKPGDKTGDNSGDKPELPPAHVTNPHLAVAHKLAEKLKRGEQLSKQDVFAAADEAHGGTRAEGKYGQSEAYDSLEAAMNLSLEGKTDPKADLEAAKMTATGLSGHIDKLPTQTNRDGNKDAFQQFSTPPHYAFATTWLANLKPG